MTSVAEIQREVAERFGTPLIDMVSQRRAAKICRPRQVAIYLARHLTVLSLPAIGRHFGGRDHTTIMHAIKRIEELASSDADFGERVASLRKALSGGDER
jgi:chromosomal replication initiator protein